MPDVHQNTLYLLTPGSYVSRDHLTLQVEVPAYPPDLPQDQRRRENATGTNRLSVPIHHLESVCLFGQAIVTPHALELCWENGVAVNYLTDFGRLQARLTGIPDSSLPLRRAQFRTADDPVATLAIARQVVAGKLHNARTSLLRAARESGPDDAAPLQAAADSTAALLRGIPSIATIDALRGAEGIAAQNYFSAFSHALKQQRRDFAFTVRTRRPPRDRINCLLSFIYAILRHDCASAAAAAGLDPFVGFLHADRVNRPSLALDLMEEFRPWVADRLAITLINRQQLAPSHFVIRDGGAVELTEAGRRTLLQAYQERKQETLRHPLLDQNIRLSQFPFVQARILARHLRGDVPDYLPATPK